MAKKKLSRTVEEKQAERDILQQPHQEPPIVQQSRLPSSAMDDAEEKVSKLKSLNEMLLKETTAKRKEVSSLLESKKSLETELTRSSSEIEALKSELAHVNDGELKSLVSERDDILRRMEDLQKEKEETDKAKSEEIRVLKQSLEKMNGEMKNLKQELSKVCKESMEIDQHYKNQVEETVRLKKNLSEVEAEGKKKDEEVVALKLEYDEVLKAKNEMEMTIESSLSESNVQIQKLERDIKNIKQEKDVVEKENSEMRSRIESLVKEADELNQVISSLRTDSKHQKGKLLELETDYIKSVENQHKLSQELASLCKENSRNLEIIENYQVKISEAENRFTELERELESAKEVNQSVLLEKNGVQKEKEELSSENVKMQEEVIVFKQKLSELEESLNNEAEKNKNLMADIGYYKSDFDRVSVEKDGVQKEKDQMCTDNVKLQEEVTILKEKLSALEDSYNDEAEKNKQLSSEIAYHKSDFNRVSLQKEGAQKALDQMSSDNVKLHEEITILQQKLSALEDLYNDEAEKNKQLSSEIVYHKSDFNRASLEKDGVQKALEVEKTNVKNLQVKLTENAKKLEDFAKQVKSLKGCLSDLADEKERLETKVKKVLSEKLTQGKKLEEAQKVITDLQETVSSKSESLKQALMMLKKAAEQFTKATEEGGVIEFEFNEQKLSGDFAPYMGQLEAIRVAFANREIKVEKMKQQVDSLQVSVKEAEKKKGFWTLVSSATTILAAVVMSYAYGTKLR